MNKYYPGIDLIGNLYTISGKAKNWYVGYPQLGVKYGLFRTFNIALAVVFKAGRITK